MEDENYYCNNDSTEQLASAISVKREILPYASYGCS